jgi:hypothetical protein
VGPMFRSFSFRAMLFLGLFGLLLPASASATKYSADFMTKGTGARPLAMGGAFTAVSDDADALFFNPGALARLESSGLSLMHSERFGGLVQVDHAGYHRAVDLYGRSASIGISVLRVGVDNIVFTGSPEEHGWVPEDEDDEFSAEDIDQLDIDTSLFRTVSDQEWAILGVYSSLLGEWSLGGSVKVIYQSVGEYNSFGFGLDAGVMTPRFMGGMRAGLKLQDITGTYIAWSTGVSEFVAPSIRPGLSWEGALGNLGADLLLAADFEIRFENYEEAATYHAGSLSFDPHLGMELWLVRAVAIRLGLDGEAWTAGGGLRLSGERGVLPWDFLSNLSLDYGFGNHEDLDGSHRVGLGLAF